MEEIKQLGNVFPTKKRSNPNQGRVYDVNSLAPSLNCMGGGNRQPMIVEAHKIKMPKVIGGLGEKKSNGGQQYFQQDRVYDIGDVAMALPSALPGGSYRYLMVKKVNEIKELNPKWIFEVDGEKYYIRIRKLTCKECFRLMGFTDEEFEKAEKVNSNTQLYKEAGNSIVVNVLEAIFAELFKEELEELWNE